MWEMAAGQTFGEREDETTADLRVRVADEGRFMKVLPRSHLVSGLSFSRRWRSWRGRRKRRDEVLGDLALTCAFHVKTARSGCTIPFSHSVVLPSADMPSLSGPSPSLSPPGQASQPRTRRQLNSITLLVCLLPLLHVFYTKPFRSNATAQQDSSFSGAFSSVLVSHSALAVATNVFLFAICRWMSALLLGTLSHLIWLLTLSCSLHLDHVHGVVALVGRS